MSTPADHPFELSSWGNDLGRVTFRSPPGTPPTLGIKALRRLDELLQEVESLIQDRSIRALLINADQRNLMMPDYDPAEIRFLNEEEVVAWSHEAQTILRRLEELSIPTVAAIQGEWSGAGAEVALACSYRVASSNADCRIGFPQTRHGFLPAWGGTVRLPRLVGLTTAARLILTGEPLGAAEAEHIGLVDQVYPVRDFRNSVERFAREQADSGRFTKPRKALLYRRLLNETAPGRKLAARRAGRTYRRTERSDVASEVSLALLLESSSAPLEQAFAKESAVAGQLIREDATRARLYAQRLLDAGQAGRVAPAKEIKLAAVIGAGQTGSDLAHLLITAGITVRLKDSPKTVRTGVAQARHRLVWEQEHGRISESQATSRSRRIDGVTGFGGFGTLDLLVAAPDGTDDDPASLLANAELHVQSDCVLGFHDWIVSPTIVQQRVRSPERVLALSCPFPADRFPLVEIVPGASTAPAVTDRVANLVLRMGLTPVVVSDRTPTPAMRLLGVYFAEAARLLSEGATVSQVDEAMTEFGFLVGPFHRIDAIGSLRTYRILARLGDAEGERMRPSPLFSRTARGAQTFYRYRHGTPVAPHPALPLGLSPGGPTVASMIQRRISLLLVNEAAKILESDPQIKTNDLDLISLLALGFPRERGGLLYHADRFGPQELIEDMRRAASRFGERFAPATLIRAAAASGRGFLDFGEVREGTAVTPV